MNAVPSIRKLFRLHVGLTPFQPCMVHHLSIQTVTCLFQGTGALPIQCIWLCQSAFSWSITRMLFLTGNKFIVILRHCLSCRASKRLWSKTDQWNLHSDWWITTLQINSVPIMISYCGLWPCHFPSELVLVSLDNGSILLQRFIPCFHSKTETCHCHNVGCLPCYRMEVSVSMIKYKPTSWSVRG